MNKPYQIAVEGTVHYQVHYRVGDIWKVYKDDYDCEIITTMETFSRMAARSLVERGEAVEAMVVRIESVPFSELSTRKLMSLTNYTVVLPLLV